MARKKSGKALKKPAAKKKIKVVMEEFKDEKLKSGSGKRVTNPKQAIAIALSEGRRVAKKKKRKK